MSLLIRQSSVQSLPDGGQQVFRDRGGDAETTRGILRIGDHQVDVVGLDDVLQVVGHNPAAGRREDIADEENVHA